ncbi:LysR family transcriptional regulator [Trinickia fusca]|uniref:LysR family transcriptional regulator n=1 Tax=Trinickia fusca TaxID=2419777 RepID=A0A494XPP1_9BURK|nr:LysR family transcriptional regulator [Trinickia fusca]RKP52610.1 LysR family transcriptional regulator [Trinickia fusca]
MNLIRYAENLSVFVAVARARSFSAVARQSGVAPSSVVRQIDTLEAELGTPLFLRSTRGLLLTDAGETLLPRAADILAALVDTRAEIAALGDEPQGLLRIACLPTFGRRHILPWLPALLAEHPRLQVEFDFTERLTDPVQERMDAVVRIGELQDSSLYATRIGTQRRGVYASPAYLTRRGCPAGLDQLAGHDVLDKCHSGAGWPAPPAHEGRVVLRCDDYEALRQAALGGLGLALLPSWVVSDALACGTLVKVFDDPFRTEEAIHVLRALPRASAKVGVFTEHLRAAMQLISA